MLTEALTHRANTEASYQLDQTSLLFLLNKWDKVETAEQDDVFKGIFSEIQVIFIFIFSIFELGFAILDRLKDSLPNIFSKSPLPVHKSRSCQCLLRAVSGTFR